MGNCGTTMEESKSEYSFSISNKSVPTPSPKKRFRRRTSAHKGVMSGIAMKFADIRRSFEICKSVFELESNGKELVLKNRVPKLLNDLGISMNDISNDENNNDKIDFPEFIKCVGNYVYSNKSNKNTTAQFLTISKGFLVIEEAFNKIDIDHSGRITTNELKEAFLAMKEDDLIEERMKELDMNGDKEIEFPEFLYGMASWVGMTDEEYNDDDDDDDDDKNDDKNDNDHSYDQNDSQSGNSFSLNSQQKKIIENGKFKNASFTPNRKSRYQIISQNVVRLEPY